MPAALCVAAWLFTHREFPRLSAAVAIALVLSSRETRLYHDKFNFSTTPARWQGLGRTLIRQRVWQWFVVLSAATAAMWLLYHALRAGGFDWRLAAFSFTHVRMLWVALAVAFIYATYWGRAIRWAVFLRPLKPNPSMRNLVSATVVGFTAITLLGRPGEFVRPYLIAIKEEVPIASQVAAWVLERIADLVMVLLLFGFALARVGSTGIAVGSRLAWVLDVAGKVAALTGGCVVVVMVFFHHFTQPGQRMLLRLLRFLPAKLLGRAERLSASFFLGVESTRSGRALLEILIYSMLEWLLIVASYGCLAAAFTAIHLDLADLMVLIGFISLGAGIQIPGVGGGIQVMAVLVLTELFRVRLETATAFAFLTWIITFVAIVPPGLVISTKEGLEWRKLRRISSQDYA
jgi:glycosyltransferase 2 family protein